jgi:hypothetical protein
MKKFIGAAMLGSAFLTVPALAQTPKPPEKCRVAEVNPVTNHAECVDPFDAPIDPKGGNPCHGMQQTGGWTMSNGCDTPPAPVGTPSPN